MVVTIAELLSNPSPENVFLIFIGILIILLINELIKIWKNIVLIYLD